jgi:hypothetical protein
MEGNVMGLYSVNDRSQNRRDTEENWNLVDPTLLDGELVIVDGTNGDIKVKAGDGKRKFSELPYVIQGEVSNLLQNMQGYLSANQTSSSFGTDINIAQNPEVLNRVTYADLVNSVGYRVVILSSNGNVFGGSISNTVLSAKVYRGTTDVTDSLLASKFKWYRYSNDTVADATWNSTHAGVKTISITKNDVNLQATYKVDIVE